MAQVLAASVDDSCNGCNFMRKLLITLLEDLLVSRNVAVAYGRSSNNNSVDPGRAVGD